MALYKRKRTYVFKRKTFPLDYGLRNARGRPTYSSTRDRARGTYQRSGGGVTSQYNRTKVYQKKFMPKRKKVRWRKFAKKVKAVADQERCGRSVVFNISNQCITTGTGQAFGSIGLLNVKGTNAASEIGMGDLWDLLSGDGDLSASNSKMLIKSAVLDITFEAPVSFVAESITYNSYPLEVDVYEMSPKKRPPFTGMIAAINDAASSTPSIGGGYTALTLAARGCTVFQLPQLLSYYTVMKKTKYTINPGSNFTYQIRDPKNRTVDYNQVVDFTGTHASSSYGSRIVLAVAKNTNAGALPTEGIALNYACTRTYFYNFEGCNTYKDGWRSL